MLARWIIILSNQYNYYLPTYIAHNNKHTIFELPRKGFCKVCSSYGPLYQYIHFWQKCCYSLECIFRKYTHQSENIFLSTWHSFCLNCWCYMVSDDTTNYKKIGRTNLLLWENWTLRTHFNFSSDMCITKAIYPKYSKQWSYFLAYTLDHLFCNHISRKV